MYIPKYFQNVDLTAVREFIASNGFAILTSSVNGRPWATHIPLLFYKYPDGREVLTGHISRGNRQWKEFNPDEEVLAIFSGPHTYISSSWYDHENVPTWNYLAAHVYGKIKIVEGDILRQQLSQLVDKYEKDSENPVSVAKMSEQFFEREIKGIIGFGIEITEIQAVYKLSQNRDGKNHKSIVSELEKRSDPGAQAIAEAMKNNRS